MSIAIYGASDDLIEIDGAFAGHPGGEEYNPPYGKLGWLRVNDADGNGLRVGFRYGHHGTGTWNAIIGQLPGSDGEEGAPIPWPVHISAGKGELSADVLAGRAPADAPTYTVVVTIDCPETVTVTPEWDTEE